MLTRFGEVVPLSFTEVEETLEHFTGSWWIAGGWAIDLYLGRRTRDHDDVEIAVRFDDQGDLREALSGWDLHVVDEGSLRPWERGDGLELPLHQLWARRDSHAPWSLEILFEATEGDEWIFRRDPRVRLPVADFGRVASNGLPIVAPEVELLFKAKDPRVKDESDFAHALPALDPMARAWLHAALTLVFDDHPWLRAWDR
ncbi:MAG: amino acid transporter [Actinomycetia bacterium]|nr:amino acid transporter [Actinomycetes bacterium]